MLVSKKRELKPHVFMPEMQVMTRGREGESVCVRMCACECVPKLLCTKVFFHFCSPSYFMFLQQHFFFEAFAEVRDLSWITR